MKTKTLSFLLLASSFILLNCSNDDILEPNNPEEKRLENYRFPYMHYPISTLTGGSDMVILEYNSNNRPIKRVGGLLSLPMSTGFSYQFSPDVYNEITYSNNTTTVISKLNSSQGYTIAENKRIFEIQNGKIVTKTISSTNEVIEYLYDQNKISKMISSKNNHLASQSNIYYNQNGNVDSIVTRSAIWNDITSTYEINFNTKSRMVEVFKNYDNKANPTKNLMIFDEIFPRSLSENNYNSYESKTYDYTGQVYQFTNRNWTLNYTNNEINFGN